MERDDIQVETLFLTINCPGMERMIHYLLARCRVGRGMIPGGNAHIEHTLLFPAIERRILYLKRCRVCRGMISRWKRSQ